MADERQAGQPTPSGSSPGTLQSLVPTGLQGTEASALQIKIKNSICKSIQSKVDSIVQDVERFTDIEKLYLYLRLPSGPSSGSEKNEQSCVSSSRVQQMHAFSWIRNHLEEHPETSLPKQEVYDEYKSYCDNLGYHALSAADFGKIMKNVFPNMKARRLGMRGKSKYCYSGLRKKPFIHMPSLPNLDVHKTGDGCEVFEPTGLSSGGEDEVRSAACDLVCEWAHKVLSRKFDSVEDLARFLLNSHYISTKSIAALTVMTGSPSGAMMSVQSSAFVPTADAHSFQPQVKTLASPSIDAKQQLQRKIQQKQQEQKLRSPHPPEAHSRRTDGCSTPGISTGVSCASPALLSPQPTIGIVVAAVPSPVTVQRNRPLMSPSPVPIAPAESKVLPVHFQVVAQAVQPVSRCPKTPQNVPASPVADRPARHRYPQILPKPAITSTITLRSPPALLIAKSSKTLVPTPKDSPVSILKMTAISLGPSSTATVDTMTTSNTARPASAGIASLNDDLQPVPRARSGSVAAVPSKPEETGSVPASSTKFNSVEDVVLAGGSQGGFITQEAGVGIQPEGALKPRAASVPTPLSNISAGLDVQTGTKCMKTMMLNDNLAAGSNNDPSLYQGIPRFTTSSTLISRDLELASVCHRKREGLHTDASPIPVKKAFISEVRDGLQCNMGVTVKSIPRADPVRPESAPASAAGKVMMGMNSNVPTHSLPVSKSLAGSNGFQTVGRAQGITREGWEASVSCAAAGNAHGQNVQVRKASFQTFSRPRSVSQGQWESGLASKPAGARAVSAPGQALLQQHASIQAMQRGLDGPGSFAACWDHERRDRAQQGTMQNMYEPAAMSEAPAPEMAEYVSSQPLVGYIPFNEDDMTQDSIVEELVQMEEQMKSSMQDLGGCGRASMQGQQAPLQKMMSTPCHTSVSYYNPAHTNSSTSVDTPSYSTDMMGGGQGLTRESPCSRFAPTTPVDSALGSSCQTPIGTPHSNCSSSIPPSPVECRNPFAFTPINSNVPGYHDGSIVSSSPVKPMQRPMATHPDKAKLEWMNNGSSSSNGISILPNYQNLVDDQFRKPHAFAIPGQSPVRHHDVYSHRLTPISPVQQQVASMANLNKQEGFAVPAPLDNKAGSSLSGSGTFRCRSVSPAVRQRKLSGTPNPSVARYLASPFNSQVTPEVLNIFANSQTDGSVSSMAQRSQSVPLNVMMQTDVLPLPAGGQSSSAKKITSVLLSKMDGDGDAFRGLGVNSTPSGYTARMNLSQILETTGASGFTTSASHQAPCTLAYNFAKPAIHVKNCGREQTGLAETESQGQGIEASMLAEERQKQALLVRPHQPQQALNFNSTTVKDLFGELSQNSDLSTGGTEFPGNIQLGSEFSSSINDLNSLDTNLLFDPNQQQGQYEESPLEELKDDPIFQQICSETANSTGFDWLESKDQATVEMLG